MTNLLNFILTIANLLFQTAKIQNFYRRLVAPQHTINPFLACSYTTNQAYNISLQKLSGRWTLGSWTAVTNNGAISASVKPAMPQPMRVTRNVNSG